jgi:hypothetical protein
LKRCKKRGYNPDMTAGDITQPEVQDLDKVENFFPLKVGVPTLIGSSEDPVKGFETVGIYELRGNEVVSKYAVQLLLLPDGRVIISRPKFNLSNGQLFISENVISAAGRDHRKVEIGGSNEYDAGVGGKNLENLYVGDNKTENCFSLSIVKEGDECRVRLNEVVVNGKNSEPIN